MKNPTKLNNKLRLILPILLFITLISGFFCINIFSAMSAENSETMAGNMQPAIADGSEHDQGHNYTANINNNLRTLVSLPLILAINSSAATAADNDTFLNYSTSLLYLKSELMALSAILRI